MRYQGRRRARDLERQVGIAGADRFRMNLLASQLARRTSWKNLAAGGAGLATAMLMFTVWAATGATVFLVLSIVMFVLTPFTMVR